MKFDDAVLAFLKELSRFDYTMSSIDLVWNVIFPNVKGRWHHVIVTKYRETYYISHVNERTCGLEVTPEKKVQPMESMGFSSFEVGRDDPSRVWGPMIDSARAWLAVVARDWIKANSRMQAEYPLNCRVGIAPNSPIRASLTDVYRIDKELGSAKSKKFIRLVEEGFFNRDENTNVKTMSAKQFFDYCRIAYIAAKRKDDHVDESLTGRGMYERYADGRHEGLLDIDENSPEEFAAWIDGKHPKKTSGGHPWEIKRGGNTTHISLNVHRPLYRQEGFTIVLCGAAITRIVETIQMFLAIHEASLPISIDDPDGIRRRLLAQDNIGIIPHYDSLHRANQQFPRDQHVYDVMYYSELGRYKRRITPFITWEALPLLKLREI